MIAHEGGDLISDWFFTHQTEANIKISEGLILVKLGNMTYAENRWKITRHSRTPMITSRTGIVRAQRIGYLRLRYTGIVHTIKSVGKFKKHTPTLKSGFM